MQSYFHKPWTNPSPFDDPKNNHLMTAGVRVVGHSNGVLCILKSPDSFFLWNPTTRISKKLPKLELDVTRKYGFGWDEGSDSFKVFAVVSDGYDQNIGKVYSSKTDSWKTAEHGCLALCRGIGTLASGKIHWLKEGGIHIETFDLNTEVFGMIDQPACDPKFSIKMWLYEVWGLLGVGFEYIKNDKTAKYYVLMKEYGVKESLVDVTGPAKASLCCCSGAFFYIESLVSPVSFS